MAFSWRSMSLAGVIAFSIGAAAPPARAQGILYGCSRDGDIFTIDTASGAGTPVGTLPNEATEIEYDNATGRAFSQLPDGTFAAQEFDITTGAGIGGLVANGASFTGLEYVGSTLYGTAISTGGGSAPSTLLTLDPAAGSSSVIGPTGAGPISGLAYDEVSGTMYGIAGGSGPANLYTVDLATGAATVVGSTGIQAGSLEFGPDGRLYAGGTGTDDDGLVYTIDPASGASTLLGPTGFGEPVTGLALVASLPPVDCPPAPLGGCLTPAKAQLVIQSAVDPAKNKLQWKWLKGPATSPADFGNPVAGTSSVLCLYDSTPSLVTFAHVAGDGTCAGKPCWKANATGFKFKNKAASGDGITGVAIKAGDPGKSKIQVKGSGANLSVPPLPLNQPVRMQLSNGSTPACFESVHTLAKKNEAGLFKDKEPN